MATAARHSVLPLTYFGLLAPNAGPFGTGLWLYLPHHALSLLSWSMMALNSQCHAIAAGLLLLEATAPFTNGLWVRARSSPPQPLCALTATTAAAGHRPVRS